MCEERGSLGETLSDAKQKLNTCQVLRGQVGTPCKVWEAERVARCQNEGTEARRLGRDDML